MNYDLDEEVFSVDNVKDNCCLIVVDVQNDFCPGGTLAIKQGDKVVPVLNSWIQKFHNVKAPIVYTRDWHPKDHISFLDYGGIWPSHCVQQTYGAEFHPDLVCHGCICSKGFIRNKEAYSGFDGYVNGLDGPRLDQWLKQKGVEQIYVGGLATDYCVKATALDGIKNGYKVYLLENGIRAVDVKQGDGHRSIQEMTDAGVLLR